MTAVRGWFRRLLYAFTLPTLATTPAAATPAVAELSAFLRNTP